MPFLVQTLALHSVIVASIKPPIISQDAVRVYRALSDKISRRAENETIHVVVDITPFDYSRRFSPERFVKVISKIYEHWHYRRTMVLWIAVDDCYKDTVTYLVQKWCLPIYIRTNTAQVFDQIEVMYGQTSTLVSKETQA